MHRKNTVAEIVSAVAHVVMDVGRDVGCASLAGIMAMVGQRRARRFIIGQEKGRYGWMCFAMLALRIRIFMWRSPVEAVS